ncbi:MAG: zinc-ribbon domain-containing protein [Lachnospiraceae bacterium]|nr:zinc-ribbon domain-containing protein [Lachnospiraceae bacterium]
MKKNRLSDIVNSLNKVANSVTKAAEDKGFSVKNEKTHGNVFFPNNSEKPNISESQIRQESNPSPVQSKQRIELNENAESAVYFMYVCPECKKVFRTKGNDKKVRCTNCPDIYLKDTYVSEVVWRSYSKEEREKIINSIVGEEIFEEVFEEETEKELPKSPVKDSFFGDDFQMFDPIQIPESTQGFANSNNALYRNTTYGFDGLDSGNSIKQDIYKTNYGIDQNAERNSGRSPAGKLIFTMFLLLMVGILCYIGSIIFDLRKQLDEDYFSGEVVNETANNDFTDSETTEPVRDYHAVKKNYYSDISVAEDNNTKKNNSNKSDYGVNKEESNYVKEEANIEYYWILNTNTKKIHYPNCSQINKMSEKNKKESHESLEELERKGYVPCQRCF